MRRFAICMIAATMIAISCGEDELIKDASVSLEMTVGDESLALSETYMINGVDIQFTNVAFYVGDMTFFTSSLTDIVNDGENRYQLIKPGMTSYDFSIPYETAGSDVTIDRITFIVGVDSITNAQDEVTFDMRGENDPLGPQNPSMHWGWAGQYRFLSIDANADLDGDGEFETPLVYHIGKDQLLGQVSIPANLKLEERQNEFRLKADFAKLLAGVDFATEQFTKAGPDEFALAQKIVANYASTFTIE